MSGRLAVVGLGPGDARWLTAEAEAELACAHALYGYLHYLDRVPVRLGQTRHPSDNREEDARAVAALRHAAQARRLRSSRAATPGCSPWRPPCARRSRRDRHSGAALRSPSCPE